MFARYLELTKPGIILGNVMTALGGFFLASRGAVNFTLFISALLGLSCVIASACVFNNTIDCSVDEKMARTKKRALPKGEVSLMSALFLGFVLGALGFTILAVGTHKLTVFLALLGYLIYIFFYSFIKYRSVHATAIGSLAGAMPPVIGYTAACNCFDLKALILFSIVALWQMPHFFAIAIFRLDDYEAASIPVLPVKRGIRVTKLHMIRYSLAFIAASLMLPFFGYTGYAYLTVAVLLSLILLFLCYLGFKNEDDKLWARQIFLFSLVAITLISLMISIDFV